MAAPPNEFSLDLAVMTRAAEHYHRRTPEREQNLKLLRQKRYDEVEPKERLAQRANRLLAKIGEALPRREKAVPENLRELVELGRIEENEITSNLMECVIGETRDFLSVGFLEEGLDVSRRVGRIVMRLGSGRVSYGTGFLVSPRLLLSNQHVLRSEDDAEISAVEFDYQLDLSGAPLAVQKFELDSRAFFLNNRDLDFALVAVKEESAQRKPLRDYGWCPLIGAQGKIRIGEPVNVIQHPRGEMKQIILRENNLVDLPKTPGTIAHYEGDTEPGSSGSPVFNDQWELVALHHSGVPKMDGDGNFLDVDGDIWRKGDDLTRLAWVANEGIRVSSIVDYIAGAKVREHEEALREEVLKLGGATQPQPERVAKSEDNVGAVTPSEREADMKSSSANGSAINLQAGSVTVTIPLNITVSLGTPAVPPATVRGSAPGEGLLERIKPDPDY